jgi:hypothetical protein
MTEWRGEGAVEGDLSDRYIFPYKAYSGNGGGGGIQ